MQVSRYIAPFSQHSLMSATLDTSTETLTRKSPRPSSGLSTRRWFSRVSRSRTNLMPYLAASSWPRSSAVTMVIRSGAMPMCRSTSGSTPWPMLPKPTNRMRAGNSRWILCFWLMMDTDLRLRVAGLPKGINRLPAAQFVAAGRRRMTSARAPVRRIGAFVTGQSGKASERAPERRIVHLDRHEARGELCCERLLERAFQQLNTREDDQIHCRAGISHDPFGLRQPPFDGAGLTRHRVHRRGDRVAAEIGAAGKNGFSNEVHVRLDVGLVLTDDAHDGARLLGRAPEERWLRVL